MESAAAQSRQWPTTLVVTQYQHYAYTDEFAASLSSGNGFPHLALDPMVVDTQNPYPLTVSSSGKRTISAHTAI